MESCVVGTFVAAHRRPSVLGTNSLVGSNSARVDVSAIQFGAGDASVTFADAAAAWAASQALAGFESCVFAVKLSTGSSTLVEDPVILPPELSTAFLEAIEKAPSTHKHTKLRLGFFVSQRRGHCGSDSLAACLVRSTTSEA